MYIKLLQVALSCLPALFFGSGHCWKLTIFVSHRIPDPTSPNLLSMLSDS